MPLYEYLCTSCGHRFERIQKFSDPPIGECPSCGAAVEKQISSPAIQFKGSGWYITDYARSGKSDSKPDAAPAPKVGDSPASAEAKAAKPSTSESAPKPAAPAAPAASEKK